MGMSSWVHWVIVLVVVILIFGTKRLKNVGQDLGEAVRGFKKGIGDEEAARLRDERSAEETRTQAEREPGDTDRR